MMDFETASKKAFEIFNKLDKNFVNSLTNFVHWEDDTNMEGSKDIANKFDSISPLSWMENGCTKLVLAFNVIPDYVIKIPFFSECDYGECDDDDDNTIYFDGAYQTTKLYGVLGNYHDYCLLESEIYQLSISYGVEKLFAETSFAFDIYGVPIYLSKKVQEHPSFYSQNMTEDEKDLVHSVQHAYESTPAAYMDTFTCGHILKDYGKEMFTKFLDFCKDVTIEDIHGSNVGLNDEGKFCFLDYSGYNE